MKPDCFTQAQWDYYKGADSEATCLNTMCTDCTSDYADEMANQNRCKLAKFGGYYTKKGYLITFDQFIKRKEKGESWQMKQTAHR